MSKPLALPRFVKRAARALRDNPRANRIITAALRPAINRFTGNRRQALIAHFPRVGRVSAALPNGTQLQMECAQPESIINSIYYEGWVGVEPEVLPLWFELAKHACVIIDIGAHVGHFGLVAAHANPAAQIFSYEPLPRIAALLRSNVALNRLSNIEVRGRALGRHAGTLPFYAIPDGLPSSSSLSKPFMDAAHCEIVETAVEVSTLDAEGLPQTGPVLIKIDTETTEPDIIAGGAAYIHATIPLIVIEIIDNEGGAMRLAHELGAAGYAFDAYLLTDQGPVARSTLIADPRWRNYLLVPRDRARLTGMTDVLKRFGISCSR